MVKKILFLVCTIFITSICAYSQSKISGIVKDSISGEVLVGAIVSVGENHDLTNNYGRFITSTNSTNCNIEISYLGYETYKKSLTINSDTSIVILLRTNAVKIDGVTVKADFTKNSLNCKQMSMQSITQTPTSFGEPDVIKVMQLQPGIKNIGDGSSGLFVRGGNTDQNLIYIDEASMYSTSHMYGFVSICNPFLLKSVKFYNSYIPSEYGGRISSVLDMQLKEGNKKTYAGSFNIGTLSTNIGVEGPIIKDKASFFVAARGGNLNYILKDLDLPSFNDVIAKVNVDLNKNNTLFLSAYLSQDKEIKKEINSGHIQKNNSFIARWACSPKPNIFINTSLIANNYKTKSSQDSILSNKDVYKSYNWSSGVQDYVAKTKIELLLNPKNRLAFGGSFIYHQLTPGESSKESMSIPNSDVLENSIFIEDNIYFTNKFKAQIGIRYMEYWNVGKAVWYSYDNNYTAATATKNVEDGGIWNRYNSLEPRVKLSYLQGKSEYAISYTRTSQSLRKLSNNTLAYSNIETWVPASPNIKPMFCDNISAGYLFSTNSITILAEAYYKHIKNQIDFIDHAKLFGNPHIESQFRAGSAQAYGFEISLQKKSGKFTGQASYSLSKVEYNIPGITNVNKYSAPYDIPQDFKIQLSYEIIPQLNVGVAWVYSSGRPVTTEIGGTLYSYSALNSGDFTQKKDLVPIYSERNSVRLPSYHRLDISCSYDFKAQKHFSHSVSAGIFNAYGRENPMYYDVNLDEPSFVHYSFKYLPSLSYKLKIF